jgi:hypothetical protein
MADRAMTKKGVTWREVVSRAAGGALFQRIGGCEAAAAESGPAAESAGAARFDVVSAIAGLGAGEVSRGVVCARAVPAAATNRHAAIQAAIRPPARARPSAFGCETRDGEEDEEERADPVDGEEESLRKRGREVGVAEQIVDALPQRDDERGEEHERPASPERDDEDDSDQGDDERIMPIEREPPADQIRHARAARCRDGGNVWESNPPRTAEPPDRRI